VTESAFMWMFVVYCFASVVYCFVSSTVLIRLLARVAAQDRLLRSKGYNIDGDWIETQEEALK
jgi:hypothetical protein